EEGSGREVFEHTPGSDDGVADSRCRAGSAPGIERGDEAVPRGRGAHTVGGAAERRVVLRVFQRSVPTAAGTARLELVCLSQRPCDVPGRNGPISGAVEAIPANLGAPIFSLE